MSFSRDGIIEAIRSGSLTQRAIAVKLGVSKRNVGKELYRLRVMGRVKATTKPDLPKVGGHFVTHWSVVETYKPKRNYSPETLARFSEACRRLRSDPDLEAARKAKWRETIEAKRKASEIKVPSWVLASHRDVYTAIARVLGEEDAARWAREAKNMASVYRPDLRPKPTLIAAE